MLCKYVIKNITEEVLYVNVSIGVEQDQSNFLIAGESQSKVDLMPWADNYTFTYTFIPIKLGMLELP